MIRTYMLVFICVNIIGCIPMYYMITYESILVFYLQNLWFVN